MWTPPYSNGILIQEEYWPDEWKVLTCCLLLNLTSIKQVKPMIHDFFKKYPNPDSMTLAEDDREVIKHQLHKLLRESLLLQVCMVENTTTEEA